MSNFQKRNILHCLLKRLNSSSKVNVNCTLLVQESEFPNMPYSVLHHWKATKTPTKIWFSMLLLSKREFSKISVSEVVCQRA